ncbi:hypothetical protein ASO20_01180 [Mycoplasma sp. (ex Biomphalaria glabrata)]|uniref:NAD-dependent DNA ligase LigA n=1 Tax=Mycoplasma sp. (ex Biomphalaria glabrata) TaxID=1749074 RepID=UPI00073A7456|nr:NAD-dependent DNA ligase LigA [Mycoplasma sp. (ex Biomphalaria glabrata)]ALV23271.1 hypothetical protein ASO20_01180 [Mycoplasma sp. (ex Biomphalaria glabrata)]
MNNIKERIEKLVNEINKYNHEYYSLNQSSISDQQFDAKLEELKVLEKKYPEFILPNSPTQQVGKGYFGTHRKIKHLERMFSLDNAFSFADLLEFEKRIIRKLDNQNEQFSYVCEYKIDGLSLSIHYENGKLVKILTRGDGEYGEDVTENLISNPTIPQTISIKDKHVEIRGEIILSKENFANYKNQIVELNKELLANNLKERLIPANPRNTTSGLVRDINKNKISNNLNQNRFNELRKIMINKLIFFGYNIEPKYDLSFNSQLDILQFLKINHFNVEPSYQHLHTMTDIKKFLTEKNQEITEMLFEADGIVIKINEFKIQNFLGNTDKFPRWAIAYKFPAQEVETELKQIYVTIGRTGKVTYNAKLDSVILEGSRVTFSTLHNYDYVEKLDIREGDFVFLKKAGGIIPKVLRVNFNKRQKNSKKFSEITICPICGSELIRYDDDVDQYCPNLNCSARIKASLIHFCSRNAMDIQGMGEKIIEYAIQDKIIETIEDIYKLAKNKEMQLALLKAIKKFSKNIDGTEVDLENSLLIKNLVNSIENSKKNDLVLVLTGLGIRHVGQKIAKILAKEYKNIDDLINATIDDMNSLNIVGEKIAYSVFYFLKIQRI